MLDVVGHYSLNPKTVDSLREELLEKVWDLPPTVVSRAPDQFIHRLRKIFEPDPGKPRFFTTLRDAGYRFVPDSPSE